MQERAGCPALGTDEGTSLMERSKPCRKWAMVEILFYPTWIKGGLFLSRLAFLEVVLVLMVSQDAGRGQPLLRSLLRLPR